MRGTGVTVAVIDSGVYREHPDFKQEHILDYYDLAGTDDGVTSGTAPLWQALSRPR